LENVDEEMGGGEVEEGGERGMEGQVCKHHVEDLAENGKLEVTWTENALP